MSRVLSETQAFSPTTGPVLTKAYVASKGSKSVSLGTKAGGGNDLNARRVAKRRRK